MQKHEINSLPKSLQEAKDQNSNKYYTGKSCKKGHDSYRYTNDRVCAECVKIKVKKQATIDGGNARRWANKTPEQLSNIYKKRKNYYIVTKDKRLEEKSRSYKKLSANPEWVKNKNEKIAARRKQFGRKAEVSNPEVKRRYKQSYKGKINSAINDAKRRAAKLQRTPAWLTEDDLWMIEEAYELAALRTKMFGFSWHVDHIIPLQGKLVSGLHTPYNLQVIPGVENIAKANRYILQ